MKPFLEQYSECKKKGFCKPGKFTSFIHHPELLPLCPSKRKKMFNNPRNGFRVIACGRFGGDCSSKNKGCRKLRGVI